MTGYSSQFFDSQNSLSGDGSARAPFVDGLITNADKVGELLDAASGINCGMDTLHAA